MDTNAIPMEEEEEKEDENDHIIPTTVKLTSSTTTTIEEPAAPTHDDIVENTMNDPDPSVRHNRIAPIQNDHEDEHDRHPNVEENDREEEGKHEEHDIRIEENVVEIDKTAMDETTAIMDPTPTATTSSSSFHPFDVISNPHLSTPGMGLLSSFFGSSTMTTDTDITTDITTQEDLHQLSYPTTDSTTNTVAETTPIEDVEEFESHTTPNPLLLDQEVDIEGTPDMPDDGATNDDTAIHNNTNEHSAVTDDNNDVVNNDDNNIPSSKLGIPTTNVVTMMIEDPRNDTEQYENNTNVGTVTTETVPDAVMDRDDNNDITNQDRTSHANTETVAPVWTTTQMSLVEDVPNDENLMSVMIETIMSNAVSRKILEEQYQLVAAAGDDDQDRDHSTRKNETVAIQQLQEELHQREQQLFSKTEQITMMEAMHENETQELLSKIQSTKEEAKRRIQKAKERVDAVELTLKNMTSHQSSNTAAHEETIQQQSTLITELRKEGEKLAQKQADMELVVRASKTETRELRKQIDDLEGETNMLTGKLQALEVDYKGVQAELSNARQGISQVGQLDTELRTVREENEKRASTILTLEQAIKELKATNKEMENELKVTRKGAAIETEQERKRLIMEHNQIVSDMEMKLQATEREAAIREDALRVEIDDLRKRWQESVRRADTLSVDIQANTAPLLRQIDSINKQSRIRASAWAELETQLRNEIENSIVIQETLTKECNEWKTKLGRLDRANKEYEGEVKQLKAELFEQHEALQQLQQQYDEAIREMNQLKTSLNDMERLSNESVARVRSEMTRKLVDNEEQYRTQMETIEQRLQEERNLRSKVEVQLMEQQSNTKHYNDTGSSAVAVQQPTFNDVTESQQRLRQSQDQADILVGALGGLVGNDYNDVDDIDAAHEAENETPANHGPMNSLAALEELTSRLKASKMELSTLRTRLVESEKVRQELLAVVDESRIAREELPIAKQRIEELTLENRDLKLEIQGHEDDIADMRELYRNQLNGLIEDKALATNVDEPMDIAS